LRKAQRKNQSEMSKIGVFRGEFGAKITFLARFLVKNRILFSLT